MNVNEIVSLIEELSLRVQRLESKLKSLESAAAAAAASANQKDSAQEA